MKRIKTTALAVFATTILTTGLYSCNNDDSNIINEDLKNSSLQKTLNENVSSMYIDNGLNSESPNNILVFESREALESVFNQMMQEYDLYNNSLDKRIPEDLADEDLENYIIQNNLDEDFTLNSFEKELDFKSLRKDINEAEVKWLQIQGEIMDINTDPDNHFIISDFERTLLNKGSELIIKNEEKEPIILKYFEWGHIEISDLNTDFLKEVNLNNLTDPQQFEILAGNNKFLKVFWKNRDGLILSGCRKSGKKVEYYNVNGTQIKGFTSQNQGIFDNTLVSKTKGYQWKRGQWRNRKLWVHAGITGLNKGDWKVYNNCTNEIPGSGHWKDEKRYKLEYRLPNPNPISMDVKNNTVYSYHSEGGKSIVVDFYDYNSVQF